MWIWILVGVAVLAVVVWACWPRKRGINDADAISRRYTTEGGNESASPSIRNEFPPF